MGNKALEGVRVLDLSRVLAGPHCAAMLAGLGAEVLKLEEPGSGDESRSLRPFSNGESAYYMNFNRGKKGITLNLKTGKDIFLRLIKGTDILVENFRPGVMKKLGLDYETLSAINPGLIYVAISGYGQTGKNSRLPGYDPIAQAMSGISGVTGWPDSEPSRCGAPVSDVLAGINGAVGALAALHYRERTGLGQMIDISLIDVSVSALASLNQVYLSEGRVPSRQGNGTEAAAPGGSCHASDGTVVFAAGNDRLWPRLAALMGQPELAEDERFSKNSERVKRRGELEALIDAWAGKLTSEQVVSQMRSVSIPAGPVYTIDQVVNDDSIANERNMFVEIEHPNAGAVRITNNPIKMSLTQQEVQGSSPTLGQDNEEVFCRRLGMSEEELQSLRNKKII